MGANFIWLVRILMIICYPIAYPIGKVNLETYAYYCVRFNMAINVSFLCCLSEVIPN